MCVCVCVGRGGGLSLKSVNSRFASTRVILFLNFTLACCLLVTSSDLNIIFDIIRLEVAMVHIYAYQPHGLCTFGPFIPLSPLQNQLSFTEVDFSLFVLELPFQNEKRKSSSTIHFRSQIKKQKLEFTVRFGTSASNSKSRIVFALFILERSLPKRKAELLKLNFRVGT